MSLYDFIWQRKSTRKYDTTPLDENLLEQISQFAEQLKPLYPNIKMAYNITSNVKTILPLKAPHFFVISSEQNEGYLENVGFMFQQMDLFLSSLGLASCWYGGGKPASGVETKLPFVIILAFGKAAGNPHRELAEFKRKPLSAISNGHDERLEAARVAPSGVNFQNWFFEVSKGNIQVFQKKVLLGIYNKLGRIDIGIALCHLFLATEHNGGTFVFSKEAGIEKKGYVYIGTIQGEDSC